ncbi:hypothetical protein OXIME_000871 [Oxyplasma meridianum]|uniref:Type IV secretion system protein n=1 Tax=Oxyplasma meridianum TaxID=3073602 RepID=A0AAX4NGK7_9ARCH
MIGLSEAEGLISAVLTVIEDALSPLISLFWYYAVYYGLNPHYSFGIFKIAGISGLYNTLLGNFYIPIISLILILSSFVYVVRNSLLEPTSSGKFIVRLAVSVSVGILAYQISLAVLDISRSIFLVLWNGNVNWYALMISINIPSQITQNISGNNLGSLLLNLVFYSGYFAVTMALLGMLALRQALILFFMVTLPVFTVLSAVPGMEKTAINFWKFFIGLCVLPFFVLIPIYISTLFPNDFILRLALISLAAMMPILLLSQSPIFRFSTITSFLSGASIGSTIEYGTATAQGFASIAMGNSDINSVMGAASLPLMRNIKFSPSGNNDRGEIDFNAIEQSELRSGINDHEKL